MRFHRGRFEDSDQDDDEEEEEVVVVLVVVEAVCVGHSCCSY